MPALRPGGQKYNAGGQIYKYNFDLVVKIYDAVARKTWCRHPDPASRKQAAPVKGREGRSQRC